MKPGPKPTGRKVRGISIALRASDVKFLAWLSAEIYARRITAGEWPVERPSVSAAVRWLIDQYVMNGKGINP